MSGTGGPPDAGDGSAGRSGGDRKRGRGGTFPR